MNKNKNYSPRSGARYGSRPAGTGQVSTNGRECHECEGFPYHATWCAKNN